MGDYAELKRQHPDFFSEAGVSSLLLNTARAEEWLEALKREMELLAVPCSEVMQQNLETPTKRPTQREKFWDCFARDGWSGVQQNYGRLSFARKVIFYLIVPICRRLGVYNLAVKFYMRGSGSGSRTGRRG